MNRNEIVEALARSILETTQEYDHIESNVDRDMEELGDDVLSKCQELAPMYLNDEQMPDDQKHDWIVTVQRDLRRKEDDEIRTVYGKMRVHNMLTAISASDHVTELMNDPNNPLQTTDSRIVWNYDDDVEVEDGVPDGWEYVDFTFDISEQHMAEQAAAGSIFDAEYVSVWDGGVEIRTKCKLDYAINRVYDVESVDAGDVETLDEEYVETSDGTRFEREDFFLDN